MTYTAEELREALDAIERLWQQGGMATDGEIARAVLDGVEELRAEGIGPCVEWTGQRDRHGYGKRYKDGGKRLVHRLVWEGVNGPIPKGFGVCHKCDNPPCYRLDHLFLGTQKDNMQDAASKGRIWNKGWRKKACRNGHPYTEENTYYEPSGRGRQCRTCIREGARRRRAQGKKS